MHAYFEGELIEHEDPDDLCCSGTCAVDRCNRLSQQEVETQSDPELRVSFTYHREGPGDDR